MNYESAFNRLRQFKKKLVMSKITPYEPFPKPRLWELDVLRGLAVVGMMVFHFTFDLTYFGFVGADTIYNAGWLGFQQIIAGSFVFIAGLSFDLSHSEGLEWLHIKKRIIILGFSAALVSIVTFIMFGDFWVKFGILHCILSCSLLSIFLIRLSNLGLILIIFLLSCLYFYLTPPIYAPQIFDFIIRTVNPHLSVDYHPIFPMIIVFFSGILLSRLHFRKRLCFRISRQQKTLNNLLKSLIIMGKNSLLIYLIHQPIFFGAFLIFIYFWK